jgi:hypothetical protein
VIFLYREHDKGPDELCEIIKKLIENDLEFNASILGSHTNDIPGWIITSTICLFISLHTQNVLKNCFRYWGKDCSIADLWRENNIGKCCGKLMWSCQLLNTSSME